MSSKNQNWNCYAPLMINIFIPLILSSCGKENITNLSITAKIDTAKVAFASDTSKSTSTYFALNLANDVISSTINLSNASNKVITGKIITGGKAIAISLSNCHDIQINNCKLFNSSNVAIYLYNCYNIIIKGNYIANVSTGVYVDHAPNGGIDVSSNWFLNMKGPYPRGQFVQFNNVKGANNKIYHNLCENVIGKSNPEDAISLYQSYGTILSPIAIVNNSIKGGGPSTSGGGIMLGDGGGSNLLASGNILVNPGQYGIAISGGDSNSIINNKIYGAKQSFTNIGLYVASFGSLVTNSIVSGNKIRFYNAAGQSNAAWIASGIGVPVGWSTNDWNANIDGSMLPKTLVQNL